MQVNFKKGLLKVNQCLVTHSTVFKQKSIIDNLKLFSYFII